MYRDSHLRGVICNAEMIKREIIEDFGLPAEKIHVIYNAIDSQRFLPPTEAAFVALRNQWNLPLQATCLIYVGSGFERKGLNAAIRAIAPTDRYLLVVGKDKDQHRYQALAKTLNCEERVRFSACSRKPCRSIRWPTACCCRRCTIRSLTLFSKRWPAACRSLPPPARRRGVYRSGQQWLCLRCAGYPGASAGGDGASCPRVRFCGRPTRPRTHHDLHQRTTLDAALLYQDLVK